MVMVNFDFPLIFYLNLHLKVKKFLKLCIFWPDGMLRGQLNSKRLDIQFLSRWNVKRSDKCEGKKEEKKKRKLWKLSFLFKAQAHGTVKSLTSQEGPHGQSLSRFL